jgi:putative membrane protein insertion efficiency factor
MKLLFLLLIRMYQLCLSPFVGNCCRFWPSCSEYAYQAIQTHGVTRGAWLALKRLLKCAPWSHGGYDPVPELRLKESSNTCQVEGQPSVND